MPSITACVQSMTVLGIAVATPALGQCGPRWIAGPDQAFRGVGGGEDPLGGSIHAITLWDPDGPGPGPAVTAVAGDFTTIGDQPAGHIGFWDGVRWHAVGAGVVRTGDVIAPPLVRALAAMPDGDLIAAGSFQQLAGVGPAARIARWNGTGWSAMGPGFTGVIGSSADVHALLVRRSGELIAAGGFSQSGAVALRGIARWEGAAWAPLGTGFNGTVYALTELENGDLVAAGEFTTAGGQPASGIACWDGAGWRPLASGIVGRAYALLTMPNGDLIAAGTISRAGGLPVGNIARWDGSVWRPMPGEFPSSAIYSLALTADGRLVAAGAFNGQVRVTVWDGASWSADPAGVLFGPGARVRSLYSLPDGGLLVGGAFLAAGSTPASCIARMDGAAWSSLGDGVWTEGSAIWALSRDHGRGLLLGGSFLASGGGAIDSLADWDGSGLAPLGPQAPSNNFAVSAMLAASDGSTYVAGGFSRIGDVTANSIARWNGDRWWRLGAGLSNFSGGQIVSLAVLPGGDLVAAGSFLAAGGRSANRIARWNGSAWSTLGSGLNATVRALRVLPDGSVVVAGSFTGAGGLPANRVARWDGARWSALGDGLNAAVVTLELAPDGSLLAGGSFTASGATPIAGLAAWDGRAWSAVPGWPGDPVRSIAISPNSKVHALSSRALPGGYTQGVLRRWTDAGWTELAAGGGANAEAMLFTRAGELVFTAYTSAYSDAVGPRRWSPDGIPWIAREPRSARLAPGADAELVAAPATGYDFDGPLAYRWRREGADLTEGPGGASAGGGVVSGAAGTLTGLRTAVLRIAGFRPGDAGAYQCIIANGCGEVVSELAYLLVPACDADFNGDGLLDFFDYDALVACFEGGACPPAVDADFNRDGFADFFDYADFVAAFEAGC